MNFLEEYKDDMTAYVKNQLEQSDTAESERKLKIGYSRFEHTMRVFKWMERLYASYPDKERIDLESLSIATIFHDIGYCAVELWDEHAKISAVMCREYLEAKNYDPEKLGFICDIIARHSDKETLHDDIPGELILLMEADLLDDTGAQGVVMDVWLEAACEENVTFESILAHMERYSLQIMQDNPMRTEEAKRIWDEKKKITETFVQSYREDLQM